MGKGEAPCPVLPGLCASAPAQNTALQLTQMEAFRGDGSQRLRPPLSHYPTHTRVGESVGVTAAVGWGRGHR